MGRSFRPQTNGDIRNQDFINSSYNFTTSSSILLLLPNSNQRFVQTNLLVTQLHQEEEDENIRDETR